MTSSLFFIKYYSHLFADVEFMSVSQSEISISIFQYQQSYLNRTIKQISASAVITSESNRSKNLTADFKLGTKLAAVEFELLEVHLLN
jgi:hypothetical protein